MPELNESRKGALALGGMAAAGVGLFVLWALMSREPDPYHERRFSADWRDPIQQQMNPDAAIVPPPEIKPLARPKMTTLPVTRPTTRPTTRAVM